MSAVPLLKLYCAIHHCCVALLPGCVPTATQKRQEEHKEEDGAVVVKKRADIRRWCICAVVSNRLFTVISAQECRAR